MWETVQGSVARIRRDSLAASSSEKRAQRRAWEVEGALGKTAFLGLTPMTNEFYLWDGTKMVKAREVRRTTTADRWDKTAVETIARFPWSHHAHAAPPRAILEDQEPPETASTVPQATSQIRDLCPQGRPAATRLHGGVWEV